MSMDFDAARISMVNEQLMARGISDKKVLAAFRKVPRHEFIPPELADSAYDDHPLPIGNGQTISQPYMVALMTECLKLKGPEKVLEIGTGSGYQLAILLEIVKRAYSVERVGALARSADTLLGRLGYANFMIVKRDGTLGLDEYKPYDGIIVTAAAPRIPASLISQLNDGGRLVIPVGTSFSQTLTVIEKRGSSLTQREVCGCVFVPLVGKDGWQG